MHQGSSLYEGYVIVHEVSFMFSIIISLRFNVLLLFLDYPSQSADPTTEEASRVKYCPCYCQEIYSTNDKTFVLTV